VSASIGIDVGSTNLKIVVLKSDNTTLASTQRALSTHGSNGRFEQEAESLWQTLLEALAEAVVSAGNSAESITSIGVCSQYSSIVPVDEGCEPVGQMVCWRDHRGTGRSMDIMSRNDDAFMTFVEHHGIPPVGGGLSLGHLLALQLDEPDQHARTRWYLEPMDYVVARLTGRAVATQHSMFMSQVCDNRTLGATTYDPTLLALSGVDADRLPPLVVGDEPVGTINSSLAESLGLGSGVEVCAGVNDTAAAGLAAGIDRDGVGALMIGTTSVIVDTVAIQSVDLDHEILSMPGADGGYLVWAENGLGGLVLDHVMRNFVYPDDGFGKAADGDPYAVFDNVVESSPVGSEGLLFLPWLSGSLSPAADTSMRGGYINMSLDTTREHLVRAAAEGIAHNLAWLLSHVDTFRGESCNELVFVGGVARAGSMCRLIADICNRRIGRVDAPQYAVARGVARHAAAISNQAFDDPDTVVEYFDPDPSVRERYGSDQQRFERAHDAMKQILAPIDQ
jgi:xylulokinase